MKIRNKDLKRRIIEISYKLKLSHIGSCLTSVDVIEEIYANKNPEDKFVLSAGHSHLAHVVVREKYIREQNNKDPNLKRYEDPQLAENLIKVHGIHCDIEAACDASSGSLGHGIGIALGMALADKTRTIYCVITDGETREGSVWEALRIQKELNVDNLLITCLINGWGAYHKINQMKLANELMYMSWVKPVFVDLSTYNTAWLSTQEAHYKVMNKEEYSELMGVLS